MVVLPIHLWKGVPAMPVVSVTSSCSSLMLATTPCETVLKCVGSHFFLEVQVVIECSLLAPYLIPQIEALLIQCYLVVRSLSSGMAI